MLAISSAEGGAGKRLAIRALTYQCRTYAELTTQHAIRVVIVISPGLGWDNSGCGCSSATDRSQPGFEISKAIRINGLLSLLRMLKSLLNLTPHNDPSSPHRHHAISSQPSSPSSATQRIHKPPMSKTLKLPKSPRKSTGSLRASTDHGRCQSRRNSSRRRWPRSCRAGKSGLAR